MTSHNSLRSFLYPLHRTSSPMLWQERHIINFRKSPSIGYWSGAGCNLSTQLTSCVRVVRNRPWKFRVVNIKTWDCKGIRQTLLRSGHSGVKGNLTQIMWTLDANYQSRICQLGAVCETKLLGHKNAGCCWNPGLNARNSDHRSNVRNELESPLHVITCLRQQVAF